jgi:hypothetical protein
MKFAKWLFGIAAVFGLLSIAPLFFLEEHILGAAAQGEVRGLYYGFASVTLAWQVAYLLIALDPSRYRFLMLVGAAGKTGFGLAVCWLWLNGALAGAALAPALADLALAALFVAAFIVTPQRGGQA